MSTWVKVARYQQVRPANYLLLPLLLALSVALGALTAHRGYENRYLISFFFYFTVLGMQTIGRSLPFGLMLGASRRSFYAGTALLGTGLALGFGLVLTVLQAIERATGGWGVSMYFFRVPYLLSGPWYLTWLTSAVGIFALYVYGMWHGIVNHRWGPLGTVAFLAAQALVVVPTAVAVSAQHWHVFSSGGLPILGLTGIVAALAVLILAGGHATIRRATV